MSKKAPPPLEATSVGNRQMLPRPTADPAAARINPSFEFQLPRVVDVVLAKSQIPISLIMIYIIKIEAVVKCNASSLLTNQSFEKMLILILHIMLYSFQHPQLSQ